MPIISFIGALKRIAFIFLIERIKGCVQLSYSMNMGFKCLTWQPVDLVRIFSNKNKWNSILIPPLHNFNINLGLHTIMQINHLYITLVFH